MYGNEDQEDLKNHIFVLKKQLMKVNADNYLLKVKVRKLQDEVQKKQRQIDSILDPAKSSTNMGRIFYEHSASFLINMKEKNDDLMELLSKKDAFIRHLKKQLEVVKLYSHNNKNFDNGGGGDKKENDCIKTKQITLKVPTINENIIDDGEFNKELKTMTCGREKVEEKVEEIRSRSMSWTSGFDSSIYNNNASPREEEKRTHSSLVVDIKDQYKELPRGHLLSIIENLKNNQRHSPFTIPSHSGSSRKSSPNSDLDRIELLCDSPHEEIQQLQIDFLDMVCEVDKLKNTISDLQTAKSTKNKKRPKSEKPRKVSNASSVVNRIYNSKSAKDCSKGHCNSIRNEIKKNFNTIEKNTKINRTYKEAAIQVEDPMKELPGFCTYIEKKSIVLTEKKSKDKDNFEEDIESQDCI